MHNTDFTMFVTVFLLIFIQPSRHQIQNHDNSFYTAAVVEYRALGNTSLDDPKQILKMNAMNYIKYINQAAIKNVDIIVFPECGLSTIYLPQERNQIRPFLTPIPDPKEDFNPCTDKDPSIPEVLKILSCAARNASLYVVANLPEIVICEGKSCPTDGAFFYNTNIVFDRRGKLIARYRKYNLFGEPGFNITSTAELSTFDTDFGIRFGMTICFDIFFHDPIMKLVKELGITDMVYSVAWFSELPFLTAVQVQSSWSYATDVNLLASGYDDPANHNGGSGIYAGKSGILKSIMPFTKNSEHTDNEGISNYLLISKVPKNNHGQNISNILQNTTQALKPGTDSERNFFSDYLKPYTTKIVDKSNIETTVCDRDLCCNFHIKTKSFTAENDLQYRMAVFNGVRPFFGGRTAGIQVCSVIACGNKSLESCGQPVNLQNETITFSSITIQGKFNRTNSIHMPTTLLDSILPLNAYMYKISSTNISNTLTDVQLQLKEDIKNLRTFGIYTREYGLDDFPFTISSSNDQ